MKTLNHIHTTLTTANLSESEFVKFVKSSRAKNLPSITEKGLWLTWIYIKEQHLNINAQLANKIMQFNKSELNSQNKDNFLWLEKISYSSDYIGILK